MQPPKKKMAAEERVNHLIEKTIGVLANSNYRTATTAKIASEAGISEQVIYQRFASKKDLFIAVLDHIAALMLEGWSETVTGIEDPRKALIAVSDYHYDFVREKQAESKIMFQAISEVDEPDIREDLREHFREFVEFISQLIARGKSEGLIREEIDEVMAAWLILSVGIGTGFMSLFGFEEELDRKRLATAYGLVLGSFARQPVKS